MTVVANVAVNLDARGVVERLKAIRQTSIGAADGFSRLQGRAQAVKAIVEAQQGSFAKASTVQGVFAAKVKNTEAAVRAQIAALRDVQSNVQLGGAIYQKAARQISQYEQTLRNANAEQRKSSRSVSELGAVLSRLAIAYTAIQSIKFVFAKAAEIETQIRSLQVLTGSVEQAKKIVQELQQLGAVTPFTSAELIDAAKRLQAFGVETEKVVDTTRRLADVSGATGAELQGLVTAYGQVQAKGRLQGEELLQFQERGVALQKVLREEYNLSGTEFQKALEKGEISAEAVEYAILKLTDAGGKYANGAIAQSDTLNGKLSTLQDSFQRLAANIGTFFEPVFKFLIDGINAFIERVNSAARLQAGVNAFQQASERTRARFGARAINPFDTEVQQYRARLEKSLLQPNLGAGGGGGAAAPSAPRPRPQLGAGTGGGGAGGRGGASKAANEAQRAAEAAAKEAERVAQVVRERLAEGQVLQLRSEIQDKIAAAEIAGDKQLAIRLQGQQKELDIQYKYAQALAQEKNVRAQQAIIFQAQTEIVANNRDIQRQLNEEQNNSAIRQIDALQKIIGLQVELTEQQKQQKEVAEGIANTVGQGLTSAFDSLIQGSEDFGASLRKIASGVLVDIAKQLIQVFVIQKAINALGGLFGGGGFGGGLPTSYAGVQVNPLVTAGLPSFMAKGGPVRGGSPYIVGERGPELFVPNSSGSIVPNSQLGGMGGNVSVTVNVDASGSQVQGDANQAKALGGVISAAVQSEIIKQQRPGGLLAGTR